MSEYVQGAIVGVATYAYLDIARHVAKSAKREIGDSLNGRTLMLVTAAIGLFWPLVIVAGVGFLFINE